MKLLTETQYAALLANGHAAIEAANADRKYDPKPIVQIVCRNACCRWLLVAIDPNSTDWAYGLIYNGDGRPRIGFVQLSELEAPYGEYRDPVEPDPRFVADKPLSMYAESAYSSGHILT
jgi:hypothetical protein